MIPYQSNIYCDILACRLTEQLSNSQSVEIYTIKLSESPEGGSDPFSQRNTLQTPILVNKIS